MQTRLFDPAADVAITHGRLPHWEQVGAFHFITFHAADSLPRGVRDAWHDERDRWLWSRGIDVRDVHWEVRFASLPAAEQRAFRRRFAQFRQHVLDQGHGSCVLRQPRLRGIVVEALRKFDGDRYTLEAFAVMPNHVHVLAAFDRVGALSKECRGWKRFSALRLNRELSRSGAFWQAESWDHLVRSAESLERIRRYIAENPRRAGLGEEEATVYVRDTKRKGPVVLQPRVR